MVWVRIVLCWIDWFIVKCILEGAFFIFSLPLMPIAFSLKHDFRINIPPFKWMLNDTKDGDYGAQWWKDKHGIKKDSFWTAYRWWLRNSNWNFKLLFKTPPTGEIIKVISNEVKSPLFWVNQKHRGTNHAYYWADKRLWPRYSFTNNVLNVYMGVESRYILKVRRSK